MKEWVDILKSGLQLLVYAVIMGFIASLFIVPDFGAGRLKVLFDKLDDRGLEASFNLFGFGFKKADRKEGKEAILTLNKLYLIAPCLADGNECEKDDLRGLVSDGLVQSPATPGASPLAPKTWIVAAGADRTIEAARHEIAKLEKVSGVKEVGILQRDGWFRTVAFFATPEAAKKFSGIVEQELGNGEAYVRATQIWCNGELPEPKDGFYICNTS